MSRQVVLTIDERQVPHPLHGVQCYAGRCERVATVLRFDGSMALCEQHARHDTGQPIPETKTQHVVATDDGREWAGWTLSEALGAFGLDEAARGGDGGAA